MLAVFLQKETFLGEHGRDFCLNLLIYLMSKVTFVMLISEKDIKKMVRVCYGGAFCHMWRIWIGVKLMHFTSPSAQSCCLFYLVAIIFI